MPPPIYPTPQPPILLPIATSASPLHHPPYQDAFTDSHRRLFHVHISLEWHFHMRQNIWTRTNIIVVILKLFISTVQNFSWILKLICDNRLQHLLHISQVHFNLKSAARPDELKRVLATWITESLYCNVESGSIIVRSFKNWKCFLENCWLPKRLQGQVWRCHNFRHENIIRN